MTHHEAYNILASWGPRAETPDHLASRMLKSVQQLSRFAFIAPSWFAIEEGKLLAVCATSRTSMAEEIAKGVTKSRDGKQQQPYYGYSMWMYNAPEISWSARRYRFGLHGGADDQYVSNTLSFCSDSDTEQTCRPDLDVASRVLLSLAEPFEVTYAIAFSDGLSSLWRTGREAPTMQLAWISYIAPRFAHLVTPPPSAIVEHRSDGGLLMAASDEAFDVDNPRHMAVAREIEAAVAPFNALPWPPESHVA